MLTPIQNAELFLINTLFDLYLFILVIRLILCWARSNYFNPITRIIIMCTQPIIAPTRRLLPTYNGIEFSTLFLILIIAALKYLLIGLVVYGLPNHILGLFILAGADGLKLLLNTLFYAILIYAVLSWFQLTYSPIGEVLAQLTSPIMRPLQRVIPPVGGFDISPIPALIILQLILILCVTPLLTFGMKLTFV